MPSPAYLAEMEKAAHGSKVLLAEITLTTPSAVTLRVASRDTRTPDGAVWESGIVEAEPVREAVHVGAGMARTVSAGITLALRAYSGLGGAGLGAALSAWNFTNAPVTIYAWSDNLASFVPDDARIFSGRIFEIANARGAIAFTLTQDDDFDAPMPPLTIEAKEYPAAESYGMPKPVIVGEFRALNLPQPPFALPYSLKDDHEDAGAGGGVVPGILVDTGRAGGKTRVLYAGHECAELLDRANGFSQMLAAGDILAPLDTAGLTEVNSGTAEITIDDGKLIAFVAIAPVDVDEGVGQNSAGDPKNAITTDPTLYATLDQGAGKTKLVLRLGSAPDLGTILSTEVLVCAVGDPSNTHTIRAYIQRPVAGDSSASATVTGTVTDATFGRIVVASGWDSWAAGGTSDEPRNLVVDFTGGTTNKARVLIASLVVKYRPNARLISTVAPTVVTRATYDVGGRRVQDVPAGVTTFTQIDTVPGPSTFETVGTFFANVKGAFDDGTGTITGTAGAVIECAPDAATYFLNEYGGVALADMERGAASFGSFVAARHTVRDARPQPYNVALYVGEQVALRGVIESACAAARSFVKRSPKSGKFQFHVARLGQRPNFRRKLSWRDGDVHDFSWRRTSRAEIGQSFRVRYRTDLFRKRPLLDAFVNETTSGQGFANAATPDQLPVIALNVNDQLTWNTSAAGPWTETFAAGTYNRAGLLALVRAAMRVRVADMHVGNGFLVVAGFNDSLDVLVGAVASQIDMPAGDYTADEWCWTAERTLNAAGLGVTFAITYDHATNTVGVVTSGAARLLASTGTGATRSGWPVAGFKADTASGTSHVPTVARYGRATWFLSGTAGGLALTGTAARTCLPVLGFLPLVNASTSGHTELAAPIETGDRVLQAQATAATYRPKPEVAVRGDALRNQDAAAALCHWLFDLSRRPRIVATFDAPRCPDLEVGHVIEFDATLDGFTPCPDRPSWANIPFLVIEAEYHAFPLWRSRIKVLDIASA